MYFLITSLAVELTFFTDGGPSFVLVGGGGSFLNTLENLESEKYLDDDDDDFFTLLLVLLLLRRCFI